MHEELRRRTFETFRADLEATPPMSLRGGDAVDSYGNPPPYDLELDKPTDAYLEKHAYWGITYLDPASWRYYLPRLIDYALRNFNNPLLTTMAIDGLLASLRPPDHEPPRLASLSREQETVISAVLEVLAFDDDSCYQDDAMQILEEYWIPNALYRDRAEEEPEGAG